MKKAFEVLDAIVDKVLAYQPKWKSNLPKRYKKKIKQRRK
jgi:hypothetical protein